jgi:hypothetical protein
MGTKVYVAIGHVSIMYFHGALMCLLVPVQCVMQIEKLPREQIEKELAALGVAPETVQGEQWAPPGCLPPWDCLCCRVDCDTVWVQPYSCSMSEDDTVIQRQIRHSLKVLEYRHTLPTHMLTTQVCLELCLSAPWMTWPNCWVQSQRQSLT